MVLTCALYFWIGRSNRTPNESVPPRVIANTSAESSRPSAAAPESAPQPAIRASGGLIAAEPVAEKTSGIAEDPAELWKRVQRGSTDAEIELAKLYLDGTRVAQNCEQAHLLLLAAAKKQTGKAGNLLTGAYSRRCQ